MEQLTELHRKQIKIETPESTSWDWVIRTGYRVSRAPEIYHHDSVRYSGITLRWRFIPLLPRPSLLLPNWELEIWLLLRCSQWSTSRQRIGMSKCIIHRQDHQCLSTPFWSSSMENIKSIILLSKKLMEHIYILLKEFYISTTLYSHKHYPEVFYYLILSFSGTK